MRLDAYLAKEGVSATAAAKILRISRAGLYLLFHGRYPSVPVLYRIRRFTNGEVDIEDFLTPEDVILGDDQELLQVRIKKLAEAREKKRLQATLSNPTPKKQSQKRQSTPIDPGCSVWGPGVGS